jgi:hypothetical protein
MSYPIPFQALPALSKLIAYASESGMLEFSLLRLGPRQGMHVMGRPERSPVPHSSCDAGVYDPTTGLTARQWNIPMKPR